MENPRFSIVVTCALAAFLALASFAAAAEPLDASEGDSAVRLELLRGVDLDGAIHEPGQSPSSRGVAFVFLSTECPISNAYLPELNRIAAVARRKQVDFYGIISDRSISRAEAVAHRDEFRIEFPVFFDASQNLLEELRATHVPEAVVVAPSAVVMYRGAIDDQYAAPGKRRPRVDRSFLRDALDALENGSKPEVRRTSAVGCAIPRFRPDQQADKLTFSRDIAPLLVAHCAVCHRPGEAAPFSLDSYKQARRHAEQIGIAVESRTMPPWKAAPELNGFCDDLRLADREVQLIRAWIDLGCPQGSDDDLPANVAFERGWRLGQPDLVLRMSEAFEVPADGPDVYRYFVLPTHLDKDRLISAVEFRPGAASVVHHAGFWFDSTGIAQQRDALDAKPGYTVFGGPGIPGWMGLGFWTPGTSPRHFPAGAGRLIQRGADLVLQVHYHPNGKAQRDQSSVGLYFAPQGARRRVAEIAVANMQLEIPPGRPRFVHRAGYTLPVDVQLIDVYPHMHMLGREMKAVAVLPDGHSQTLIWVKDWDFRWQPRYVYRRPMHLPHGTSIRLETIYDNSDRNPMNPFSPPRAVEWGEQSTEEMGMVFFQVLADNDGDLKLLEDDNLAHYMSTLQKLVQRLEAKESK